jgi:hypothetical protein
MPVYPGYGSHETSYKVPEGTQEWVEAELADYLSPSHWEICKEKDGKSMWKKDFHAAGVKQPSKHKDIAYWKFSAVIPNATVQDIYDIMHHYGTRYQPYLTKGWVEGELVEVIPEDRRGNWCDEAVVQYRAFKLKIVNNRDFLTLTFQKNFTTPSGAQGIALLTRSVMDYPVQYPVKKGFTRAELISCCAFLIPAPDGCHYTYTQRANLNLSIPIPKFIAHTAEKGHIWRHFEVMKKCVAIHQEDKEQGRLASPLPTATSHHSDLDHHEDAVDTSSSSKVELQPSSAPAASSNDPQRKGSLSAQDPSAFHVESF